MARHRPGALVWQNYPFPKVWVVGLLGSILSYLWHLRSLSSCGRPEDRYLDQIMSAVNQRHRHRYRSVRVTEVFRWRAPGGLEPAGNEEERRPAETSERL